MASFPEAVREYQEQLARGSIQQAYRGLIEYMMHLRAHLEQKYPSYVASGVYQGYMDMTYFSFSPQSWKQRKLKAAVVFVHERGRFEVWLAGYNKQVQSNYWNLIRDTRWKKYSLVPSIEGADSILEHVLVDQPDFSDLDGLTSKIEKGTLRFIREVDAFLVARAAAVSPAC